MARKRSSLPTSVRRHFPRDKDVAVDHERAAERYAQLLGRSKGALIKAGQALSFVSLSASVPPEARVAYQRALGRLRDDAPPMDPALARAVVEEELGVPITSTFADFDTQPLAAASIGQVHRARLHDGREVAVKVQYPGVAAAMDADLANQELLSTFVALLMSFSPRRIGVDVRAVAREVGAAVRAELDYRQEAVNQREFADIYRGHPIIHVPEVVDELSTGRVLTQELVGGMGWDEALTAPEPLRESWAQAIMRFGPATLHCFNVCNVDPHPGNYRFHADGRVSFLDYGCVQRVTPTQSRGLMRITQMVLRGDVDGTWAAAVEAGVWDASAPVSPQQAYDYWRAPFEAFLAPQPFRLAPEHVAAGIEAQFSPMGPSAEALRHIHAPEGWTLISRISVGGFSVIADLDVCLDWAAIAAEFYDNQPPHNDLSARHWAFMAEHNPDAPRHA